MGKLLLGAIFGALALFVYQRAQQPQPVPTAETLEEEALPAVEIDRPRFQCDGRTHCSQMTSCAEARYFIKNCAGTKMDGDNDGVPCEDQHCRH